MGHTHSTSPRRPKFIGLFHDDVVTESYWLREAGTLQLPPLAGVKSIAIYGELLAASADVPSSAGEVGLRLALDDTVVADHPTLPVGPFRFETTAPADRGLRGHTLKLTLHGVAGSNLLAWLGRITGIGALQPWRQQARNRRLRIARVEADGEVLFDFSNRASPWNAAFARRFLKLGVNLTGYFRADLGIGESVRCMARAADAAALPLALIDLKLPCKNSFSDASYVKRLQQENPFPVNIVHVDPPGMRDLDHHHGEAFRRGKYTIGYWAWELPEFPDAWIHFADYCQEVWAPSRFAADAIAEKIPVPVLAMPHAISFPRPEGNFRRKFGLPEGKFLFLFLYDLNSYSERKNPAAVLEAFRRSGLAGHGASLVIKVHNVPGNPLDFERLRAAAAEIPDTTLITQTLARHEIYELESACDCFVSLHRSEGFGLAVAESMYLGKPVISTNWSATAEFVDETNGCPVRCDLITLDRNHGPYAKGQTWAAPDLDHAAEWMRRLYREPALAKTLGAAARATIETRFSPAAIGARYRRRLEAIAGW
jgi:glycosyltransferase involved in cell wall biosynthesis